LIEAACDLVGLEPLEVEAHGLDPVRLPGPDVLLLAAGGDLDPAAAQGPDIANDGPDPAVEQAERQVLVAEQAALLAGLGGRAEDAAASQALDAVGQADLIVLRAGIEREQDGDLLAGRQRLAGGLVGGDDQEPDPAEAEVVVGLLGSDGEDLLDGRQDGLGDEGGAVGPFLDATAEHAVPGLGVEASLPELILEH